MAIVASSSRAWLSIQGTDALEHFLAERTSLLPGELRRGVLSARLAKLSRSYARHRCHLGQRRGRSAHRRVDAGSNNLVAAGDLPPATLANARPPRSLAGGQARTFASAAAITTPPRRRLWRWSAMIRYAFAQASQRVQATHCALN